eukprot:5822410-Amphidinium_carterae.1
MFKQIGPIERPVAFQAEWLHERCVQRGRGVADREQRALRPCRDSALHPLSVIAKAFLSLKTATVLIKRQPC